MDILFTLIPLSIILIFAILVALYWAVRSGQFEDLDVEAERILLDDDMAATPPGRPGRQSVQSPTEDHGPPAAIDSGASAAAGSSISTGAAPGATTVTDGGAPAGSPSAGADSDSPERSRR